MNNEFAYTDEYPDITGCENDVNEKTEEADSGETKK